jgi:predicted SAM-dependent methyltransferase
VTPTNKKWIEKRLDMLKPVTTVEIGSLDVNGRIERTGYYVGIDMQSGPNVDIVRNAHDLQFRDDKIHCVVCCDMLEHDDAPWETAKEIHRVLTPGGAVLVTVPGIGFKRHDFPSDYWRFTAAGLKALFKDFTTVEAVEDSTEHAVRAVFQK